MWADSVKVKPDMSIIGKKFGRLTVLEYAHNDRGRHKFICKCECGTIKQIYQDSLKNGKTQSCGCLIKEVTSKRRRKDITGQRFGLLLVLERVNSKGSSYWKCKCDCGNEKVVLHSDLTKGTVKSCGCLRFTDLTGKTFDYLTVIKRVKGKDKLHSYWKCICKCGNEKIATYSELVYNQVKSCGCYTITEYDKTIVGNKYGKLFVLYRTRTTNNEGYYLCKCDCGNLKELRGFTVKGGKQISCGCERKKKGKLNKRWKGRNVIDQYLRSNINDWKFETVKKYNHKCAITNKDAEIIHHLHPFYKIIEEMFFITDIKPKENIDEYSNDELIKMRDIVIKLHKKYGLGVCLTKEIHKEFHKKYGKMNNNNINSFKEFYKNKTGKEFII